MNRREALQAGIGILSAVGIDGEVATLTPKNPQAFVITTPHRMSPEMCQRLHEQWKKTFRFTDLADVPVLLMENGMQLSVVDGETK